MVYVCSFVKLTVIICVCCCALHSIGSGTAVAVRAGFLHVCIIRAANTSTATNNGEVLCWGSNAYGQLVSFCATACGIVKHRSSGRHIAFCVYRCTDLALALTVLL
jgi:Regulator of chromosome condensation (RCC1) repeat